MPASLASLWIAATSIWLLAQEAAPGAGPLDWTTILAAYGVAAPMVAYLILENRRKDRRIEQLEDRNQDLTDAAIDKIVPLTTTGLTLLQEQKQDMHEMLAERERIVNQMHELASRTPSAGSVSNLLKLMAEVQTLLDRMDRT